MLKNKTNIRAECSSGMETSVYSACLFYFTSFIFYLDSLLNDGEFLIDRFFKNRYMCSEK